MQTPHWGFYCAIYGSFLKWGDKQIGIAILQERWWCKELLNFYVQRCPSAVYCMEEKKRMSYINQ